MLFIWWLSSTSSSSQALSHVYEPNKREFSAQTFFRDVNSAHHFAMFAASTLSSLLAPISSWFAFVEWAWTRVIIIWLPFPASCVSCDKFFLIAFRPKKSSTCDHLLIKRERRYEYKFSRKMRIWENLEVHHKLPLTIFVRSSWLANKDIDYFLRRSAERLIWFSI